MEFRDGKAIYLQIGDYICENILLKRWREGDRIPSVREMAVSIEVNPNTVMRTYAYLQEKGVLSNQRGIGYFVADQAYEHTRDLKKRDFVIRELPHLFKTLEVLDLGLDDLRGLYDDYKANLAAEEER